MELGDELFETRRVVVLGIEGELVRLPVERDRCPSQTVMLALVVERHNAVKILDLKVLGDLDLDLSVSRFAVVPRTSGVEISTRQVIDELIAKIVRLHTNTP